MKILNAKELAEVDENTIKKQNISSWDLMERAAKKAFESMKSYTSSKQQCIHIFAGIGNNGGDGLAIAYFLTQENNNVKVYLVEYADSKSDDNAKNFERLESKTKLEIISVSDENFQIELNPNDFCIDSIFGFGLNRPMPDFVQKLIKEINQSQTFRIAIDVPSGVYLDRIPKEDEEIFNADLTLTFQLPKLPFFLPQVGFNVGKLEIIDIGLDQETIDSIEAKVEYLNQNLASTYVQKRSRFSHKGTFGHALIIGGSRYMLGSVILSASSCMRSGVGKTSVLMPKIGHQNMINHRPEVMLVPHESEDFISEKNLDFEPNAIGIGVGISMESEAETALKFWLENSKKPMVIDADALNLISENESLLQLIPKNSILTPHPGELKRLIGNWSDDFDKIEKIKSFSKKFQLIILAKDSFSICVNGDEVFVNSTGNSGMATAGSGDVLMGLITSLLAQNYEPKSAAVLGMYLHGLAGNLAARVTSEESLVASDLIDYFGLAFSEIKPRTNVKK
ncbi:NAD(P)H-hydrate dehydratase [Psychroflexus aestuariivivens]|uniref:NAD(P)H-hydrate dehydratase n=1 Tax=Psychroflexus aestuariivivens TaxID=1795040 RepID=UPI000FDA6058|nr:NAD(P)H-hydrate dehydratase [Psychroflexus aestuariivivens]